MNTPITEYIKSIIKSDGRITFARFMDIALYHNDYGYYMADIQRIGKEGDFYTSPDVQPFMGKVLGEQLQRIWESLGKKPFSVIEMGAGKGLMAFDVLNHVRDSYPEFFDNITYIIIEKSINFKERQKKLLNLFNAKVKWVDSIQDLNKFGRLEGCVLTNEFVDALPFHRVYQDKDKFKEVFVTTTDGIFSEVIDEPSTEKLFQHVNRLKLPLIDGMKTEVNLAAMEWLKDISAILNKGFVITIDYGYPAYIYYGPSKSNGTFLCYYKHTTNENPYERIGLQDITAHVDFTSLALEGNELGLDLLAFTDMASFLMFNGKDLIEKEFLAAQEMNQVASFKKLSAIKNLIHPEGMGGTFKVLIQGKNVELKHLIDDRSNKKDMLSLD